MADITRTYAEDPDRCQAMMPTGQCLNKAVQLPDGTFGSNCLAHGGNKQVQQKTAESLRNYRLGKFQAELNRHATAPGIKCLRDEVAILRMVMEERLNGCRDAHDLILQSGPISDLVTKIEKVVSSCHKLEGSMGQLLDKSAILQFAGEVIDIVGSVVTAENEIEEIGNRIMAVVGRLGDKSNESI